MNSRFLYYLIVACISLVACTSSSSRGLQVTIEQIIKNKRLNVGVAIYNESGEMLVDINSHKRFPMQSVYKLPIAMAYLNNDSVNLFSDSIIISKDKLLPNTWSPFREAHSDGAIVSVREFVEYVVAKSDNNLCDVMIDLAGGIDSINGYLKGIGVDNISIKSYEREIQSSWEVQFENYATPIATIELLMHLWKERQQGSQPSEMLWQVMRNTKTGSARKLISQTTDIGYKTGFSGKSSKGITAANNCVGIIDNDGKEDLFFAIFITDSSEEESTNYEIISQIVKAIK